MFFTSKGTFIEGKIDDMGRRGRRGKQPLDDLQEAGRYGKLKEALDCPLWRTRIGKHYGALLL